MPKSFTDVQRSMWRLDRNQKILRNQREVMETLSLAMQVSYGKGGWYPEAEDLLMKVAYQVFCTCEQIAKDSDMDAAKEGAE